MSKVGKDLQKRIAKIAKEHDKVAPRELKGYRPTKDDKDAFVCKWRDRLTEFGNDSRTTQERMKYADDQLTAIFNNIGKMTLEDFPETSNKNNDLLLPGLYGDSTPQKPRKRGRI